MSLVVLISLPGTEPISEPILDPRIRTKGPVPELTVSPPFPTPSSTQSTPPSEPKLQQTETEPPADTEDVVEAQSDQNAGLASEERSDMEKEDRREQEKLEEQKECTEEAAVEEASVTGMGETRARANVEIEEEPTTERDVEDSVLLSDKERQNEEVNEKDNCSASSISSTSSTLEREEREEKFTSDTEAGIYCLTH